MQTLEDDGRIRRWHCLRLSFVFHCTHRKFTSDMHLFLEILSLTSEYLSRSWRWGGNTWHPLFCCKFNALLPVIFSLGHSYCKQPTVFVLGNWQVRPRSWKLRDLSASSWSLWKKSVFAINQGVYWCSNFQKLLANRSWNEHSSLRNCGCQMVAVWSLVCHCVTGTLKSF